jgi:hypothetical protein
MPRLERQLRTLPVVCCLRVALPYARQRGKASAAPFGELSSRVSEMFFKASRRRSLLYRQHANCIQRSGHAEVASIIRRSAESQPQCPSEASGHEDWRTDTKALPPGPWQFGSEGGFAPGACMPVLCDVTFAPKHSALYFHFPQRAVFRLSARRAKAFLPISFASTIKAIFCERQSGKISTSN